MTAPILTLIGLTAVLSVCGIGALLLRRTPIGHRGRIMNAIWAAVLLLALIPLPLPADLLPLHLIGDIGSRSVIQIPDTVQTEVQAVSTGATVPVTGEITPDTAQTRLTLTPTERTGPGLFSLLLLLTHAVGAAVTFALYLRRTFSVTATLRACSRPCTDAAVRAQFTDLLGAFGLRRAPELRILDEGILYSPCTAGLFFPCIYLPAMPEESVDVRAVLAHELCHIRRRDILRKLFSIVVVALHWFNPVAHMILPALEEDLEQSCDTDTLRILGGESARLHYMHTLLQVACITRTKPSATLFFAPARDSKNAIKRRFLNMKNPTRRLPAALTSLVLILALLLCSTVAFTACGILGRTEPQDNLTPLTEFILRYYHNLGPEDEITWEMCEAITSLELSVMLYDAYPQLIEDALNSQSGYSTEGYGVEEFIDTLGEKTLLNFKVNTYDAPEGSYEALTADCLFWIDMIPEKVCENILVLLKNDDEWNCNKFNSFYQLLDINLENETQKQKMIAEFPGIQKQPTYVVEPTRSIWDALLLHTMIHKVGVYAPLLIDGTVIDTDAIRAAFPNLEHLDLVGLRAAE